MTVGHRRAAGIPLLLAFLLVLAAGCRSLPPVPPPDPAGPGWTQRTGQAVWTPDRASAGLAGDLLVATHPDGRQFVRFTKTPFPIVEAWSDANGWEARFGPEGRTRRGRGAPPARLFWLHLPAASTGVVVPAGWRFDREPDHRWRFQNQRTGESLAGFLDPVAPTP